MWWQEAHLWLGTWLSGVVPACSRPIYRSVGSCAVAWRLESSAHELHNLQRSWQRHHGSSRRRFRWGRCRRNTEPGPRRVCGAHGGRGCSKPKKGVGSGGAEAVLHHGRPVADVLAAHAQRADAKRERGGNGIGGEVPAGCHGSSRRYETSHVHAASWLSLPYGIRLPEKVFRENGAGSNPTGDASCRSCSNHAALDLGRRMALGVSRLAKGNCSETLGNGEAGNAT